MNPSQTELYIRNCTDYGLEDKGVIRWEEVEEVVRANGETAVGYINQSGESNTAPRAASKHAYDKRDKIVVLASDYIPS